MPSRRASSRRKRSRRARTSRYHRSHVSATAVNTNANAASRRASSWALLQLPQLLLGHTGQQPRDDNNGHAVPEKCEECFLQGPSHPLIRWQWCGMAFTFWGAASRACRLRSRVVRPPYVLSAARERCDGELPRRRVLACLAASALCPVL